jgi:hypothetical protein
VRIVLIGIWIIGTSLCFSDGDDFNSPSLNTNKWSLTSGFSTNFVHTNGYISFESTKEREPQWGYVYWKEKMSLTNNWNAKIQTYINPNYTPTNNFDGLPDVGHAIGGRIKFYDGPKYTTNYTTGIVTTNPAVEVDGLIETAIGVIDNPNSTNTATAYQNTLLKGLKGSDAKKYFNPNYDLSTTNVGLDPEDDPGKNTDSQFKEISADKVLLELGYDTNTGSLYSKMFDFSDNILGSLLHQDSFKIKLIQGESLINFDPVTQEIITNWDPISDVYVFVGGDTYYSEAPQGSATLDNFEIVPEPSALSLLAVGIGGLAMLRRRRS